MARQRGCDLRYDMQITLEEAAFGVEKEIEVRKLDTCDKCKGSGAEPGSRAVTCPTCRGRGQVVSSRGFFQVSQTCPRCRGTRRSDRKTVSQVATAKGGSKKPAGSSSRSPPASPTVRACARRATAKRVCAAAPRATFTSSSTSRSTPIFQREDDNLFCEVPVSFATAALGGGGAGADAGRQGAA